MESKIRDNSPLNSTQALQCRRLIEYLAETSAADKNIKPVSSVDLAMTRQVLLKIDPIERSENHVALARTLHDIWASGNFVGKPRPDELQWSFLVRALAEYGRAGEALKMMYEKWDEPSYSERFTQDDKLLEFVAQGLAREGNDKQLVQLIEHAEKRDIPYNATLQNILVTHFAAMNDVKQTKKWFTKTIAQKNRTPEVYRKVASFAQRNSLQTWATPFFVQLGETQPRKKYWDVLLQAILLMGKSLSEVEAMMEHMVDFDEPVLPNIATMNGLLAVAAELRDEVLGQEVMTLIGKYNLHIDGESVLRLMQLQLNTGRVSEMRKNYDQVKYMQPWQNDGSAHLYAEYRQLVNEYLIAISRQVPPNFALISLLLESVDEELLRLEPATVATLCIRFLENDQHFDVMDMLSTYCFKYSEGERDQVLSAFMKFCTDPQTSTQRAWDSYQLLHQFFQDTSFERREELLAAFFARKRSDMACQVFRHMRQHRNSSYAPRMSTYLACFEGLAKFPDLDGLEAVHNMMKMDTTIQPDTKLYTALMFAFAAHDKPLVALDLWHQITSSKQGPSYASLEAVFYTLERKSGGHKQARELWDRIERMDLEVPANVYSAYIGAIAGSGLEKEVRSAIVKMPAVVGSEPDGMT